MAKRGVTSPGVSGERVLVQLYRRLSPDLQKSLILWAQMLLRLSPALVLAGLTA